MPYEAEADKSFFLFSRKLCCGDKIKRISHIGSTSIKTIWAKAIVDIMVEIDKHCDMRAIKDVLINHGYLCMSEEKNRISFNKGYTESGFADK